jgi:hypothetical protein
MSQGGSCRREQKIHSAEIHNNFWLNTVRIMKSRTKKLAGHVESRKKERTKIQTRFGRETRIKKNTWQTLL